MVALPLLYPELFQQFGVTPPRGVLFHGPPGTGMYLLVRQEHDLTRQEKLCLPVHLQLHAAMATLRSVSFEPQHVGHILTAAFFMRKGADVLSKWVGEAERQLRMLFEEARAAQPSIIFFDEIDGESSSATRLSYH